MRDAYGGGASDLEEEFELELEDVGFGEFELDEELEGHLDEFEGELEGEFEADDAEFEGDFRDQEFWESRDTAGYADRLYQLSTREFESEAEVSAAVQEVLGDMEREYFWGRLKRLARGGLGQGLRRLAKRAGQLAPGLPLGQALQGVAKLASGDLSGSLGALAKTGLAAALRSNPTAAAALGALNALGFKDSEVPEDNREAWDNFVTVAREAYEYLASNLDQRAATPQGAAAQSAAALQAGLRAAPGQATARSKVSPPGGRPLTRRRRVIHVRRGDRLVIVVH